MLFNIRVLLMAAAAIITVANANPFLAKRCIDNQCGDCLSAWKDCMASKQLLLTKLDIAVY